MNAEAQPLTLKLKPREEDRIFGGHLWVFSNELQAVPKTEPGVEAELVTAGGRRLGRGFYNPHSLIAFRFLTRREEAFDADFFRGRLERALALRRRLMPGGESFRLCFGESDGLPGLVADKFGEYLVLQVLSAGMDRCLPQVLEALEGLLHPKGILLKNDHPSRALEGLKAEVRVVAGEVPEKTVIEADGLKYAVTLSGSSQKTGFYFDQRENRLFLSPYLKDRVVLDLHCFTGAFALSAARAGAKKVLGLDSSGPAIELARENAALNGLEGTCSFDEGDAEGVLANFAIGGQALKPDVVLVDPPSFVRSRKHLSSALRAYTRLNAAALKCLSSGGLLATSTCSHHVTREFFLEMLRGAAAKAARPCRLIALRGQGGDHPVLLSMPETEYLNFALLEVL
ncbi:MAG: class I SAM-dependent rRNA methyltransferase [Elusimicrobiota bacterium]|jgi:23S rRNA (cytosine1962-C5)-methyltransferase